uniref:eIF-4F 25 kDa subunit n=2 Tax=Triatoma infestans TaxID=30076 RepID=A0A171A8L4_TRIIF
MQVDSTVSEKANKEMAGNKPSEEEVDKHSITDLQIKHPLQNSWTLWYIENDRRKDWKQNLKEIISFDTVEDFWSLYNHIKAASELKQGCDYCLFKKGIQPMWEDAANKEGGRWLISLEKKQREVELDNYWLEIMLCMIGETFDEHSDEVCGATVNVRSKMDKIGLWTANGDKSKSEAVVAIGRKIKERLRIHNKQPIVYQMHKDTQVKSGSIVKITHSL